MCPAIRVSLSVLLLLFVSCESPAQVQQTQTPPNTSAEVPTGGPTDVVEVPPTGSAPASVEAANAAGDGTPTGQSPQSPADGTLVSDAPTRQASQQVEGTDAEKVFQLTERVASLETELAELKQQLRQLQDVQRELANLRDSITNMQVAGTGEDSGRRALGAMAESPQLRGEIAEKLQGKVRLVNDTGAEQVIYINGTPWTVVEGNSFVYAPVGKVAFQRPGDDQPIFKGVQEWETNATTDEMEVVFDLADPNSRSVVSRRRVDLDQAAGQSE